MNRSSKKNAKRLTETAYKSGDRYYGGLPAEPKYEGPITPALYWKELIQYFKDTVEEYPEYSVIGTSPVAIVLRTPDGKETVDLRKFDALSSAEEAIEMASHYFDESLFENKNEQFDKKQKNPRCNINTDAGNVEQSIEMFNKLNSPVEGLCTNPVCGPMSESSVGNNTNSLKYEFIDSTYSYDELMNLIFSFTDTSRFQDQPKSELINFVLEHWDMWYLQDDFESWFESLVEELNESTDMYLSGKEKLMKTEDTLTEDSHTTSELPAPIDAFLQDIAQMFEVITYTDIVKHDYTSDEIRKLVSLRKAFRSITQEEAEDTDMLLQKIADEVVEIIRPETAVKNPDPTATVDPVEDTSETNIIQEEKRTQMINTTKLKETLDMNLTELQQAADRYLDVEINELMKAVLEKTSDMTREQLSRLVVLCRNFHALLEDYASTTITESDDAEYDDEFSSDFYESLEECSNIKTHKTLLGEATSDYEPDDMISTDM